DKFFLEKIKWIIDEEQRLKLSKIEDLDKEWLYALKKKGFSNF
ncbi:Carbamoyl-phosphate synthase large chain, partial [human gut metagenome]